MAVQLGSIDRQDDRSPYRQIADDLRAVIDGGQLHPGDRLPSETDLIKHYGVARMTVRQAIQELRTEGAWSPNTSEGCCLWLPARD